MWISSNVKSVQRNRAMKHNVEFKRCVYIVLCKDLGPYAWKADSPLNIAFIF